MFVNIYEACSTDRDTNMVLFEYLDSIYEADGDEEPREGVIVKVGNSWRIKGKKVKYWPAHYKTREDALAALRAYYANKH